MGAFDAINIHMRIRSSIIKSLKLALAAIILIASLGLFSLATISLVGETNQQNSTRFISHIGITNPAKVVEERGKDIKRLVHRNLVEGGPSNRKSRLVAPLFQTPEDNGILSVDKSDLEKYGKVSAEKLGFQEPNKFHRASRFGTPRKHLKSNGPAGQIRHNWSNYETLVMMKGALLALFWPKAGGEPEGAMVYDFDPNSVDPPLPEDSYMVHPAEAEKLRHILTDAKNRSRSYKKSESIDTFYRSVDYAGTEEDVKESEIPLEKSDAGLQSTSKI